MEGRQVNPGLVGVFFGLLGKDDEDKRRLLGREQ